MNVLRFIAEGKKEEEKRRELRARRRHLGNQSELAKRCARIHEPPPKKWREESTAK